LNVWVLTINLTQKELVGDRNRCGGGGDAGEEP
jgi:hypothetical protein